MKIMIVVGARPNFAADRGATEAEVQRERKCGYNQSEPIRAKTGEGSLIPPVQQAEKA